MDLPTPNGGARGDPTHFARKQPGEIIVVPRATVGATLAASVHGAHREGPGRPIEGLRGAFAVRGPSYRPPFL
jgi:hypothetical protein